MDRAEIEKRVKKVVSMVLNVPAGDIQPQHKFTADLGAASVQSLELVAAFEEEFDLEVDEDEALSVQTVGDAVNFFAERL